MFLCEPVRLLVVAVYTPTQSDRIDSKVRDGVF